MHCQNHFKKIFLISLFSILTFQMIVYSPLSLAYASLGLKLWFDKMIPALLPFMILSGIMIRLNLTENFISILYPFVHPLFQVSKNVCYCIFIGFLCGFPMGAKTVADLYIPGKISRDEARYLLAFVNNIGPIYFSGYVLPLIHRSMRLPYIAGMYFIPLLYGLLLRYTFFQKKINSFSDSPKFCHAELKTASYEETSLLGEVDIAIQSSVSSILTLGGYMILFNLLNLFPHVLLKRPPLYLSPFLEISGGLSLLADQAPLFILLILPFGGLSCIAQTFSCIKNTDLKISEYIIHKSVLTILTAVYYMVWKILFPETFLR